MRPLDGLLVLDVTRLLPGAAATMQLATFGARVVKIEEPGRGDYARSIPPLIDGEGAVFRMVNGGKESVALDLKSDAGRESFLRLAHSADVIVESFRPGVMQRLRLDYETLRAHNPRLIYASLSGYGRQGPRAGMAGHDVNYLALSGALDLIGEADGAPVIPGIQVADMMGALHMVNGILLALAAREKTGAGQLVEVSLTESVVWMLPVARAAYAATGEVPVRGHGVLSGGYACYRLYATADGRWMAVGALEPKFWQTLCSALGCQQFAAEQFAEGARRQEIIRALANIFRQRTADDWAARLGALDVCVTPVLDIAEAVRALGMAPNESPVVPRLSETPGVAGARPPRLGEHGD